MKLIIFFNGWGIKKELIPKISDRYKEKYKLIILNFPYEISQSDYKYFKKIIVIGWSFGVYYANKFLSDNKIKCLSIAINGTPEIIGEFGIKRSMMEYTLKNLTFKSLKQFYINMGINSAFINFPIDLKGITYELEFMLTNYTALENNINVAILGVNDKIVPFKNQKKYYFLNKIKIFMIPTEHFPFTIEKPFEDILKSCFYEL